jgi:hypothetical protein
MAATAATASAPPTTPYDPLVSTPAGVFGGTEGGVAGGGMPDYAGFFNLTNSEDWTAFGASPGGDGEAALLDQLAATW